MRFEDDLKRQLAQHLSALAKGMNQLYAAAHLGVRQADVSALRRGNCKGFSAERLLSLLARRGHDVRIELKAMNDQFRRPKGQPTVTVERYDRFVRPTSSAGSSAATSSRGSGRPR